MDYGRRQGPDDRVFIIVDGEEIEVPNLLTALYGSSDYPAWFQLGDRWVRQGPDGEPIWTDENPWTN